MKESIDPFAFFNLPYDIQYKLMLEDFDIWSIRNLCEAAQGVEETFFNDLCSNEAFWEKKAIHDFGIPLDEKKSILERYLTTMYKVNLMLDYEDYLQSLVNSIFDPVEDSISFNDFVNRLSVYFESPGVSMDKLVIYINSFRDMLTDNVSKTGFLSFLKWFPIRFRENYIVSNDDFGYKLSEVYKILTSRWWLDNLGYDALQNMMETHLDSVFSRISESTPGAFILGVNGKQWKYIQSKGMIQAERKKYRSLKALAKDWAKAQHVKLFLGS